MLCRSVPNHVGVHQQFPELDRQTKAFANVTFVNYHMHLSILRCYSKPSLIICNYWEAHPRLLPPVQNRPKPTITRDGNGSSCWPSVFLVLLLGTWPGSFYLFESSSHESTDHTHPLSFSSRGEQLGQTVPYIRGLRRTVLCNGGGTVEL